MEAYFDRLWPICRSITGNGVRESLRILSEIVPLDVMEIPTGTKIFDWTVPQEWNIRDAYIITPNGEKICELKKNNLHVVNYSTPVNAEMSWEELAPHLHTRADLPAAIPYVTSYYKPQWGFCLSHEQWKNLPREGKYKVVIDSTLSDGNLTIAEAVLPGKSSREILFSTYVCHPSMANNELSGPLAAAFLYRALAAKKDRKFTYRFAFTTETLGTLAFLDRRGKQLKEKLLAGYVLTCCGDRGDFTYKRSRRNNTIADELVALTLKQTGKKFREENFEPWGSDERQYCSPGFDLPVGVFMRTPYQQYKEYHTSLDDKSFISFDALAETVQTLEQIVQQLDQERIPVNTVQYGEPQLGKRNLYENLSASLQQSEALKLRLRLLNFCDGKRTLQQFATQYGYDARPVNEEADQLCCAGLLSED